VRCSLRKRKLQSANTWLYEAVEGLKGEILPKWRKPRERERGAWRAENGGEVTTACGTPEAHLQPEAQQKGPMLFHLILKSICKIFIIRKCKL